MGYSIAEEAANRGADVILISGPTSLNIISKKIKRVDVISAEEMYNECIRCFKKVDVCIMAAAVADYSPEQVSKSKIKKSDYVPQIKLKPTKDILKELGKLKSKNQTLIGFALETDNEIENARKKLSNKKLDYIVLNSLKDKGAGFGHSTNKIKIISKNDDITEFDLKSKAEVASDILDMLC